MAGLGLDPNAPYGKAVENKIDFSDPMKEYMATNFWQRLGSAGGSRR